MPLFPDAIKDRDTGESPYLSTDEIQESELQIQGIELIKAANPKFGANEKDGLCKKGILHEGETIQYRFIDSKGNPRLYESKGAAFYIGFKAVQDLLEPGDWVSIKGEGKGDDRRYTMTKVEKKVVAEEITAE